MAKLVLFATLLLLAYGVNGSSVSDFIEEQAENVIENINELLNDVDEKMQEIVDEASGHYAALKATGFELENATLVNISTTVANAEAQIAEEGETAIGTYASLAKCVRTAEVEVAFLKSFANETYTNVRSCLTTEAAEAEAINATLVAYTDSLTANLTALEKEASECVADMSSLTAIIKALVCVEQVYESIVKLGFNSASTYLSELQELSDSIAAINFSSCDVEKALAIVAANATATVTTVQNCYSESSVSHC